jgi:hypothetical protein
MKEGQRREVFKWETLCTYIIQLQNRGRAPNFSVWQGPYRVVALLSKLNYRVENQQGKEFVAHLNRMQRAFMQGIRKAKNRESYCRK